jgi:UDP-N-acetylglucosamine--N-acetylmuramyl-(pentapeptide) pyrophosphoryl-undecaprenol N-acetylglucosamine transferase
MKILFTGGGTGGHIFPILAIAQEIKNLLSKQEGTEPVFLFYLGPKDNFTSILEKQGIKVNSILCGKIRRYFSPLVLLQNLIDIFFKIPLGILQSFFLLFFRAPDVIFSKGGYGSFPVVLAGCLLRIPTILHESDAAPGFVNKFFARFAIEIFVSFPETEDFPPNKVLVVGNPIRQEILRGSGEQGKKMFNLTGEKPIILVMGGSQGAVKINEMVLSILPEWLKHFELLHITGVKNYETTKKEAEVVLDSVLKKYYHPVGFLEEEQLKHAYAACHLIISRAGSGSIFEIAALNKPSILVPLPTAAQDHQLKNAYAFARAGATIVIEQADLVPHLLLEKIKTLFSRPEEFQKLVEKSQEFARIKADKIIAGYIISYLIH